MKTRKQATASPYVIARAQASVAQLLAIRARAIFLLQSACKQLLVRDGVECNREWAITDRINSLPGVTAAGPVLGRPKGKEDSMSCGNAITARLGFSHPQTELDNV